MDKNKYTGFTYFLFIVFLIPGNLFAQETLFSVFTRFVSPFYLVLISPLAVFVIAFFIKIWLLKRKLSLPWKGKIIEKLPIITFAETFAESFFLGLIILFFTPAIFSLFTDIGLTAPETISGQLLRLIIALIIVMPYQCVVGAILNLLLINLFVPINSGKRRQYFKYSVMLALIFPLLMIISMFIRIFLNILF
jgi:hypothetical protein